MFAQQPLSSSASHLAAQRCLSLKDSQTVSSAISGAAGLQDVDDDQGSDSSGQSDGSGESDKGKKTKKESKRKRQSSYSTSSAEGFVEVEGDEPAQLMTMLPVSGWFRFLDFSSCILPNTQLVLACCCTCTISLID